MHWKIKSKIQNAVSLLPSSLSYATYYWAQRHFGRLRKINPANKFKLGVCTWNLIKELGRDPTGKDFLEVGTGWVPNIPLAYWLMGAKSTTTIDLNRYMKAELITDTLDYISGNIEAVQAVFGPLLHEKRFGSLIDFYKHSTFSMSSFLEFCQINYIAPGNAAKTNLMGKSIDFHTSHRVFEHIQPATLIQILEEGNRLIREDGLFVHRIDYSDHFSRSDNTLPAINFLQYTDQEWDRYAGNRYMYTNRLRHDDFLEIFDSIGHEILLARPNVDQRSLDLLKLETFQLNERYRAKSETVLSIIGSWIVSKKSDD
jgi:hypothetical protein